MSSARRFCFLVLIAVSLVAAAQAIAQPAPAGTTKEKVLVRLTWKFKGEHAPLFVALEKGYYAKAGLDVQFAEGSGAETVVKVIGTGADSIGFGPATTAAEAISSGLPIKVVAVYQPETPIGLISFPDTPLTTPKDLEGKKLGLTSNETFANLLEPFARLNHVDVSKITRVALEYSSRNALFATRKLDVMSTYLNIDVPIIEKKTGIKFNQLAIANFGMRLLGGAFFVNSDFAASHPETIRRLVRATAEGYQDARKDPAEAARLLAKHMAVGNDLGILEAQLRLTLDEIPVTHDHPIGWQDRAQWQNNLDLLKAAGVIKTSLDLDRYYTNEYVGAANGVGD
jgi:NitT/TauT family transport system substrate-binding protein